MKAPNDAVALPRAVQAYWEAANTGDSDAAAAFFSPEAVVHDEGQVHRSTAAIRAWIEATTQKYRPVVEPLRWKVDADRLAVTARVSGTFPGSPGELDYLFTLHNQTIVRLEIA